MHYIDHPEDTKAVIVYTQNRYNKQDHQIIIDKDDLPAFLGRKWRVFKLRYTYYARNEMDTYLHRFIINPPDRVFVDHINRNGLDNRKSNLRLVTRSQNRFNSKIPSHNKSGYKGVCWNKKDKRWRSTITIRGNHFHLGNFKNPKEAALAYEKMANNLHGEYTLK